MKNEIVCKYYILPIPTCCKAIKENNNNSN